MKKKLFVTSLLLVLVMSISMVFTGCGPANLQEFVESDTELMAKIEGLAEGSNMEIEIKENTMYFSATAEDSYKGDLLELARKEYEKLLNKEDNEFQQVVTDIEESTGFDVTLEIDVKDKSGEELCHKVYN